VHICSHASSNVRRIAATPLRASVGMSTNGGKKRAADASVTDQLGAKKPCGDAELKSQCVAFFNRTTNGYYKKSTQEEKKRAQEALAAYARMADNEKLEFAKKFLQNKGKGVGWVKTYLEEMTTRMKTNEKVNEGYSNRTCAVCTHAARLRT